MSNPTLTPIYERLNEAEQYHPFSAETFADWASEAGDTVTISREDREYVAPIHSQTITWKGQHRTTMETGGKKERDAVSKVSKQKYRRSAAGMQNEHGIYSYVYASESTLYSFIDQTATYIVSHVEDVANDLGSEILQTASQIRSEVHAADSQLYSYVDQTATYISSHVEDVANDLGSEILQTASQIRSEVHASNSLLYSYVDQTATYINAHIEDVNNALGSEILQTASQIRSEVHASNSELYSYVDQTATYINSHIEDVNNSLGSEILQTASQIRSEVHAAESTTYSYIDQTATSITSHVEDVAEDLGSEILQTASQIRSEVHAANSQLYSYVDQTATSITSHVEDVANDLGSEILQTASQIRSEVHAADSQLYSYVDQTATYISSHVEDVANDLGSEILQTASQIRSEVHAADSQLYSYVDQTATYIEQSVASTESSLRSSIRQQSDRISLVVEGTGNNAHIKAAEIAASINENGSQALIAADHILLDSGTTKISDILGVNASGFLTVAGDIYQSGNLNTNDVNLAEGGTLNVWVGTAPPVKVTVSGSDLRDMLVKAEVDTSTNTLKIWKRGDPPGSPSITFEKAAPIQNLTGAWSGSGNSQQLTVSTNPSTGKTYTIGFGDYDNVKLRLLTNGTPTINSDPKYLDVPMKVASVESGTPPTTPARYSETFKVNATPVWNNGNSAGIQTGYESVRMLPIWDANQPNKLTISKTTDTSYNTYYTLYVVAGLDDLTYNPTTHKYSTTAHAKAGTSASVATDRSTESKSSGTEAYEAGRDAVGLDDDFTFSPYVKVTGSETDPNTNVNTVSISTTGKSTNITRSKQVYLATGSWSNGNRSLYLERSSGSNVYKLAKTTVSIPDPTDWSLQYQGGTNYTYKVQVKVGGKTFTSGNLSAPNAYDNGWSGAYATVGLDSTTAKTLAYGESVTVYAQAKMTSGAQSKTNVASRTITAPAAPAREITYFSTSAPENASAGGYTNNSDGYSLSGSGSSAVAAIVVKGNIDVDSTVSREAYDYLQGAPTALYKKGYSDGSGSVTASDPDFVSISESGGVYTPANIQVRSRTSTGKVSSYKTLVFSNGTYTIPNSQNNRCVAVKNGSTLVGLYSIESLLKAQYNQGIADAPRNVTLFDTTAPSGASYGGYTNNSNGYYLSGSGTSATAAIVVKGTIGIDSIADREAYNYLQAAPTALYINGYNDGYSAVPRNLTGCVLTAAEGDTNGTYTNGPRGYYKSGSGESANIYVVIPVQANIDGVVSRKTGTEGQAGNDYLRSVPTNIWQDAYAEGKDYYNKNVTLYCKSRTAQSSGYYLYTFTVEDRSMSKFTVDSSYSFHYR